MSATHFQCLTPPGGGAIAVLEVSGPDAWALVRRLFRPARKPAPEAPAPLTSWFGAIGDGPGDEVIVAVTAVAPIPTIEIHCHGGPQVVRMLFELFERHGCKRAPASDDVWSLVARAKTLRTAAILLDQANGSFDRAVREIRHDLDEGKTAEARTHLEALNRFTTLGRHLLTPWRVAIAGAPNAGKSSLLNTLAGYQRSIVTPVPGTTRDVVTATLALDGWLVEFSDTAGLREADDVLEREGIDRAREQIRLSDLCLWVIDTTEGAPGPLAVDVSPERIVPVLNKIDLTPAWDISTISDGAPVSALTGHGLEPLIHRIVAALVPETPAPGAAVPFNDECLALLESLSCNFSRN
jgi:tRNA modification GTPase